MSRYRSAWIVAAISVGLLLIAAPADAARDRTPPTTPTNLRVTATTPSSISLAWNASFDASGNYWYCVQQNGSGCFRVNVPQTTFTRSSLAPNRTHTFSVYAVDAAGNRSANSNTVSFTTPPDTTPPSPPPTLSLTSVFPTRISVAWTASVDSGSQVWYSFLVNGTPNFTDQIGRRDATLLHLAPSTTYELKVTARDAFGNVAQSNLLVVTTPAVTDTQPPMAPTNLFLSSESAAPEVWLRWTQSTDNTDPQGQILYEVYLNGVRNNDGVIGYGSTITYCRAAGPTEIVLRAVDTSGNVSAPSNSLMFAC